jgi:hypothetical protein
MVVASNFLRRFSVFGTVDHVVLGKQVGTALLTVPAGFFLAPFTKVRVNLSE